MRKDYITWKDGFKDQKRKVKCFKKNRVETVHGSDRLRSLDGSLTLQTVPERLTLHCLSYLW